MNTTLSIHSQIRDYDVHVQNGFECLQKLGELADSVFLIDAKVSELYSDLFQSIVRDRPCYWFEAKEENKNLAEAEKIFDWIIASTTAKKNLNFVSVGGGITQDVSGFVASTLFRGVNWTFVPTTLLAQADSCIGGKTSLNFRHHKNLLGTFYPPKEIFIVPEFAQTLSELDLYSGYGEIIKFLLMHQIESKQDEKIAEKMQSIRSSSDDLGQTILDCLNIKRSFMEADEFDRGRRNLLNYGHCFGHALESASGYHVPHGIAVNIGIIFANIAAVNRGYISSKLLKEITETVNLPFLQQPQRPGDYQAAALLESLKNDKKRVGKGLPLVVPADGELLRLSDVTAEEFAAALDQLKTIVLK